MKSLITTLLFLFILQTNANALYMGTYCSSCFWTDPATSKIYLRISGCNPQGMPGSTYIMPKLYPSMVVAESFRAPSFTCNGLGDCYDFYYEITGVLLYDVLNPTLPNLAPYLEFQECTGANCTGFIAGSSYRIADEYCLPEPLSKCVGDFTFCTNTELLNNPSYYYEFDDLEYNYLVGDVLAAYQNLDCTDPLGIPQNKGLKVIDSWDFGDGTNIVNTTYQNFPYNNATFSSQPVTHTYSSSGQYTICHTKTIVIYCYEGQNPQNTFKQFNHQIVFECTTCQTICPNDPSYIGEIVTPPAAEYVGKNYINHFIDSCVAGFNLCSETGEKYNQIGSYPYKFDDNEFDFLEAQILNLFNAKWCQKLNGNLGSPRLTVTDSWTKNGGIPIHTDVQTYYSIPTGTTFSNNPFVEFLTPADGEICHTKQFELCCYFNTNPIQVTNCEILYECTKCLDICVYGSEETITVDGNPIPQNKTAHLGNSEEKQYVHLYPNPTSGPLNFELYSLTNQKIDFSVTDLNGRIIIRFSNNVNKGENKFSANLSELGNGNYFVKILSNEYSYVFKILVQK
ncbi:MAG: T9SS type A sorting domain-containing protein [Bacteroidetes bacterium]|nr:T9SS type A sorting domain-containing protein [Bacteroidota bacterium]